MDISLNDIKNWAILDSGATSHFLITQAPANNIRPALKPITARLPNGSTITSTKQCELDISGLPKNAREAHIIPGLANYSLVSVTKLCNAGCEVNFTKIGCTITHNGRAVLCASKCTKTGLWMIPITDSVPANEAPPDLMQELATSIVETSTKSELAQYLHQCLCSPPKSTLLAAIKNNQLSSFPCLTYELISKHLPPSTATDKGHLHRIKQGIRSTRRNTQAIKEARAEVDAMAPQQEICATHDMFCFAALADANAGTMYTDLTGQFPVRSYKNMVYIFVAYVYDANAIIVRAMPSRDDASMIDAFNDIIDHLDARGFKPNLNVMDNECSKAVESFITKQQIDIQLVAPRNHRVNAAERAIQTFKEHFIAALATIDKTCPLQLWDQFLVQVQDTLNLLRRCRRDSTISAYEAIYGHFDFNKTPLAPIGTKALIFDDPAARTSWAPHGTDGYYVGPAKKHYRNLRFWIPTTRCFCISDTYKLYPTHYRDLSLSELDQSIIAANDLVKELQQITPSSTLQRLRHTEVIKQLTDILNGLPAPRVESSQPRVGPTSTSTDATSPRVVNQQRPVHQRQTRRNTPMPTILEEDAPSVDDDDATVVTSNRSSDRPTPPPTVNPTISPGTKVTKTRKVNGILIGSKRNSAKNIKRKQLQRLIDAQIE